MSDSPISVPRPVVLTAEPPRLDHIETWIFDLDNTLYPAKCNLFAEVSRRMGEFIADYLKVDLDEAKRLQRQFFLEHGTTMRGLMQVHGMDPAAFMEYVHDIDLTPVDPCAELDQALARLPGDKLVFTNGSVAHAERVLDRLGVKHHFSDIFDIVAAGYLPKPDPGPYRELCDRHRLDPRAAAMVEDMARNLVPAHALGMTTVWVPGLAEWSGHDSLDHIHHVAEDLVQWLAALNVERG